MKQRKPQDEAKRLINLFRFHAPLVDLEAIKAITKAHVMETNIDGDVINHFYYDSVLRFIDDYAE